MSVELTSETQIATSTIDTKNLKLPAYYLISQIGCESGEKLLNKKLTFCSVLFFNVKFNASPGMKRCRFSWHSQLAVTAAAAVVRRSFIE